MSKFCKAAEAGVRRLLLLLVFIYRRCLSPLKPNCCRFTPTCSEYARDALQVHGAWKGGWLTLRRILRCHPWYHGNLYDPVPPKENTNSSQSIDP